MPFSQQSYTGQGIQQHYEQNRAGDIIGASLRDFGSSMGKGIEKFANNKSQAKKFRAVLRPLKEELAPQYGVSPEQWADYLEDADKGDLEGIIQNIFVQQTMQSHKEQMSQGKQKRELAVKQDARSDDANNRANEAAGRAAESHALEKDLGEASIANTESLIKSRDTQSKLMQEQHQRTLMDAVNRGGMNKEQAKRAQELWDKLQSEPIVKKFYEAQALYSSLEENVLSKGERAGPEDIGLVFQFMKTLDPGSTVREGEYATAANSGSVPTNIINAYNKIVAGEFLTPEQRGQFLKTAQKSLSGFAETANTIRGRFADQSGKYKIPEDMAVGNPFSVSFKVFSSKDDAMEAISSGTYKEGDSIKVIEKGEVMEYPVINQ